MKNMECELTWKRLCAEIKRHTAADVYAIWEKTFSVVKVKGSTFVLGYNDKVQYRVFTDRCMNTLYTAACAVCGQMATVKFCYVPKNTMDGTLPTAPVSPH